jgi:uncharacterized membrane protein
MRKATRRYFWDRMQVSLWFVPLVMALAAFCLSWLLGLLDELVPNELLNDSKLILAGSAAEMRSAMLGIAATILATAGVVFSCSRCPNGGPQCGSRAYLLRDHITISSEFSWNVLLLLPPWHPTGQDTRRAASNSPNIWIDFAWLPLPPDHHHPAYQPSPGIILKCAGAELMDAVGWEISSDDGEPQKPLEARRTDSLVASEAYRLRVNETGYIQFVDPEIIVNLASEKDLMVRLSCKPGQFVSPNETVALVWPAARVDARLGKHLQRAIQIGTQRTPSQDVEYAINQLVEVAVRAMSPAINDPFTAMTCLDYLADGLVSYVGSGEISPNFYDHNGKLRLNFEPASQADLLGAAFDQLRHASRDNATVLLHILDAIDIIGREACSSEVRQELLRHIHLVQMESW